MTNNTGAPLDPYRPGIQPIFRYTDKIKSLDSLVEIVTKWRRAGCTTIGISSGVFDLLHPGHCAFLNGAATLCDKLIIIIASDRTVKEKKGKSRPFVQEAKRAQSISALEGVSAVIISDTPYHENILRALNPERMFKGDEYMGKEIIGADLVGEMVFIPCAPEDFFHTSTLIEAIRNDTPYRP